MINVNALIQEQLNSTKLEILVFGPAVAPPSADPYVYSMQMKRREIKEKLIAEGHSVSFGEDIVDPSLPAHLGNPWLQELAAMRAVEVDLIVVLVAAPGAIAEAIAISREKPLCQKSGFYCFEEHKHGLVVQALQTTVTYGATCDLASLAAVQACNLTALVMAKVQAVQVGKAFLF